jgi:hypothetical protein
MSNVRFQILSTAFTGSNKHMLTYKARMWTAGISAPNPDVPVACSKNFALANGNISQWLERRDDKSADAFNRQVAKLLTLFDCNS